MSPVGEMFREIRFTRYTEKPEKVKKFIIIFIVSILLIAICIGRCNGARDYVYDSEEMASFETEEAMPQDKEESVPSKITEAPTSEIVKLTDDKPSRIIKRLAYTVSYNSDTRCANWVAWYLSKDHVDGPYPRRGVPYLDENGDVCGIGKLSKNAIRGSYIEDMEIGEPRQHLMDWVGNEYEMSHGHLCPAGDNKWSREAMNQSFLLTNMCPQDESLNNGAWRTLEKNCRSWASKHGDLFIVAGPLYLEEERRTIGAGKIAVPDAFFKVILCVENNPKGIGFVYPNALPGGSRADFVRTIDEVEDIAAMDFFPEMPDEIENELEAVANLNEW